MNSIDLRSGSMLAVLLLAGCSGGGTDKWADQLPDTVAASGVVLLDGEPLDGASLVLKPVAPGEHAASAITGSDGEFELKAFPSKDGAVPGAYQVAVTKEVPTGARKGFDLGPDAGHEPESAAEVWENSLPALYADPATSGLTVEIPPDGTSDLNIELNSKP